MAPRLEINALSKFFPGVRALDDVSMSVEGGEVRALLGENGAGKSTLGKIVAGVYSRDQGSILVDGAEIGALDEKAAGDLGIGIVHQEGSLVPQLSVAKMIFAGRQPTMARTGRRSPHARRRQAVIAPRRRHRLALSVLAFAGTGADRRDRQGTVADLRILILDEPTAALTLTETEKLFDVVRRWPATAFPSSMSRIAWPRFSRSAIPSPCSRTASSPARDASPKPRPTS